MDEIEKKELDEARKSVLYLRSILSRINELYYKRDGIREPHEVKFDKNINVDRIEKAIVNLENYIRILSFFFGDDDNE